MPDTSCFSGTLASPMNWNWNVFWSSTVRRSVLLAVSDSVMPWYVSFSFHSGLNVLDIVLVRSFDACNQPSLLSLPPLSTFRFSLTRLLYQSYSRLDLDPQKEPERITGTGFCQRLIAQPTVPKYWKNIQVSNRKCLQCFDAVGWAAGRASGL